MGATTSRAGGKTMRGADPQRSASMSRFPPALGGPRGLLDGGLPSLAFVAVHTAVGRPTRAGDVAAAIMAAAGTGLVLLALRLVRREPLRPALAGLAGLSVAVLFAATAREARAFFLPAILVDAAYGVAFAASAVARYPLVGRIYGMLYECQDWRSDARLRRLFVLATYGWAMVFAVRAGVQALLYKENLPELLAVGKVLLGWPMTLAAAALTLEAVRRARRGWSAPTATESSAATQPR